VAADLKCSNHHADVKLGATLVGEVADLREALREEERRRESERRKELKQQVLQEAARGRSLRQRKHVCSKCTSLRVVDRICLVELLLLVSQLVWPDEAIGPMRCNRLMNCH
jgi:hypothetical protein